MNTPNNRRKKESVERIEKVLSSFFKQKNWMKSVCQIFANAPD